MDWEWKNIDSLDTESRQSIFTAIKLFIQNHPETVMDHDPDWLYAKCTEDKSICIMFCQAHDGSLIGYAPFFIHPSALNFELFDLPLFRYHIRRFSITAGPLLTEHESSKRILEDLFLAMRVTLAGNEAVFSLGTAVNSNFAQFTLNDPPVRQQYRILPHGKSYQRRLIRLPSDFEEYIKSLGQSTRKNIRRVLRNFERDETRHSEFRVFTKPDDVPEFLKQAQFISDKTYQKRLIGLGLSDDDATRKTFCLAAEKGWFRSYILYCDGAPVAFQHGYIYKDTYYAESTGYIPEWGAQSVGTVMQIYRIRDLIQDNISKLDFLYGDTEKKRTLSNMAREEQNFYIVPKKFPLSQIAYGVYLFNAAMDSLSKWMDRHGIKSKIRHFLRRQATKN